MKYNMIKWGCVALLAGCTSVTESTTGSLVVDGKTYSTITRNFRADGLTGQQAFTSTTVAVGALRVSCDRNAPGECAEIVQRAELGDLRRTVDAPVGGNIFQLPFGL